MSPERQLRVPVGAAVRRLKAPRYESLPMNRRFVAASRQSAAISRLVGRVRRSAETPLRFGSWPQGAVHDRGILLPWAPTDFSLTSHSPCYNRHL